jgi:serine protease
MSLKHTAFMIFLTLTVVAGCSPSGDLSLGGVITAANGTAVDSDTNDPSAPYTQNDYISQEQLIPNPVVLGGFVTKLPTGGILTGDRFARTADPLDGFRATMTVGQVVTLEISDWGDSTGNDLDLYLVEPGTNNVIDSSIGVSDTESLIIPADGEYDIVVAAYSGTSNYLLSIGEPGAAAITTGYRLSSDFVPGELIVRFRDDLLPAGISNTPASRAASVGMIPAAGAPGRAMLMHLGDAGSTARALGLGPSAIALSRGAPPDPKVALKLETLRVAKALQRRPDVVSADPNYIHKPLLVPNDPLYALQWHYPLIRLPQAWDLETGDPDVIVGVIDTGVFLAHSDLSPNLVDGYDFINSISNALDGDGKDPDPDDPGDLCCGGSSSWHGTHVSGTVAAVSDNAKGVAGVAPGVRIMPLRVLGAYGGTSYDIRQALYYAAGLANDSGTLPAQRADIVNLSLGCLGCYSASDQQAYTTVRNAGLIVVAAAGNSSTNAPHYPSAYEWVVSVSAVDRNKQRAPYSNYGSTVDVAAPGGNLRSSSTDGVLSTLVDLGSGDARRESYEFYQGTSMATPHVVGVAALMKSIYPTLTPADFDAALSSFAIVDDLGAAGRDDIYGYGLINALKAVQYARTLANGGATSALVATPEFLDFGSTLTRLSLLLSEQGTASIGSVNATELAAWLSLTEPGSDTGLGSYTVDVDRSGLARGPYATTITFEADTGARVDVAVSMRVGATFGDIGDTGHIWVVLLDEDFGFVDQVDLDPVNGQYSYGFDGVSPGQYFVVAGSDSDNDTHVCDAGESCGAYPTLGVSTPVDVTVSRWGLDFVTTLGSTLAASSQHTGSGPDGIARTSTEPTPRNIPIPDKP